MARPLPKSALEYVLSGLVPYTEANLKLTYKPRLFFNDLEKISLAKRRALQNAFYRAQQAGLIQLDDQNVPRLTDKGRRRVYKFQARRLGKQARLLIIFDIPEAEKWKRQHLRRLLHELQFHQIQKSVWQTEYDHRELLRAEIAEYGLQPYVQLYEAAKL